MCSYETFLAEETKRRWNWENRNQKELEFWKQVPPYLFCECFPGSLCACLLHRVGMCVVECAAPLALSRDRA